MTMVLTACQVIGGFGQHISYLISMDTNVAGNQEGLDGKIVSGKIVRTKSI